MNSFMCLNIKFIVVPHVLNMAYYTVRMSAWMKGKGYSIEYPFF